MANVGDRVELASAQAGPRVGVVLAVTGSMVRIRWDTGGESSMVPGPGVLSVLPAAGPARTARKKAAPAKKAALAEKAPAAAERKAAKKSKKPKDKPKGKKK